MLEKSTILTSNALRKSGIEVLGDIPSGSKFTTYYQTKQDLLDTVVPFLKEGIESREFCLWLIPCSGLITATEATTALERQFPDLNQLIINGKIEIVGEKPGAELLSASQTMTLYEQKLARALSSGFTGMRVMFNQSPVTINTSENDPLPEKVLCEFINQRPIIAIYACQLSQTRIAEIFALSQTDQPGMIRQQGKWIVFGNPDQIKRHSEIKKLNDDLSLDYKNSIKPPELLKYIVTVLSVTGSLLIAHWLNLNGVTAPVSIFFCGIMLSAWYGGTRQGILAIALSAIDFKFFFVPPVHSFVIGDNQLLRLMMFVLSALFVVGLSAVQQNISKSLRRTRDLLNGTVQKLRHTNMLLKTEISDRKHTEKLLHAHEQEFRAIVENAPDHIIRYDRQFRRVYVNPAVLKTYDLTPEKLVGRPIGSVIWDAGLNIKEADLDSVRNQVGEVFATGRSKNCEINWPSSAGSRCYSVRMSAERDLDGSITSVLVIGRDITERKEMEEKLRASKNLLAEAEQLAHFGSWSHDLKTGYITWSDELCRIFGIRQQDFDHRLDTVMNFIHPEDRDRLKIFVDQVSQNMGPQNMYHRVIRTDGQERIIHFHIAAENDPQGHPYRIYGAVHDVTENKRSGDNLRLAYQRLSYHFENTPLGVIEFDKDLVVQRWSKRAEEIFGWTAEEAMGKSVYDTDFRIIYNEDRPSVDTINRQLTRGNVNRNMSMNRNYTKKGETIHCEWYNSVLRNEQGDVVTILSLAHDVSARNNAEKTLNESYEEIRRLTVHLQKIREEERITIAREIHDELGQQLTAIKMDVAWIDKSIPDEKTDIKRKLINITQLLDSGNQAVRRILTELRPRMLNDHGLQEAIEWLGIQFTEVTGVQVEFECPESNLKIPDEIATCIFRVCQEAFTNITRHAEAKKVRDSLLISGGNITLVIEDDGSGFDTGALQNKKSFGLLGMKERVNALGGTFNLSSFPGKGTKITITLPAENKIKNGNFSPDNN